tara:strand:+ start:9588 stop:12155 length:2568 start_codon:yes stop_codon:yes gene_type:complete
MKDLSEELREQLLNAASRERMSDARKERFKDLLESEGFELTDTQFEIIMTNLRDYLDDGKYFFGTNPNVDKLLDYFMFDKRTIAQAVPTTNRQRFRAGVIDAIDNSRIIELTYEGLQNKDEIIERLSEGLNAEKNPRTGLVLLTDKEKQSFKKLLKVLEKGDTDTKLTRAEVPSFETLDLLEESLVNVSVMPVESRLKIYNYWEGIENKFDEFSDAVNAVDGLQDDLLAAFRERGVNVIEQAEESNPYEDAFANLTSNSIFPSYIVKFSSVKIEDESDERMALKLFKKFFNMLGKEIPEEIKEKLKDASSDADAREQSASGTFADYDTGVPIGYIDTTVSDDLTEEIEQAQEMIDRTMVEKFVDPLFSILINNNNISGEYTDEIISRAKELIESKLNLGKLGKFTKDLKKIVDNQLDEFLDNYKSSRAVNSMIERNEFYLPLMNNNETIEYFDSLSVAITIFYYENGAGPKQKTFNKYSEASKFVNDNIKNFFSNVGSFIELQSEVEKLLERPYQPKFGGKKGKGTGTQYQFLGGITRPTITRLAEANIERMKEIEPLIKLIEEYIIKPLTSKNVLFDDLPEFYTSKEFKDFPKILQSSNVSMARRAITAGSEPIVELDDYIKINSFLYKLSVKEQLYYSDSLNTQFEDAVDAYTKFFSHVDSIVDEDDNVRMPDIIDNTTIMFGDTLYEIAKATESDSELNEIEFMGEPLPYWNKKQEETGASVESLIRLVDSPEWERFVAESTIKGIKTQNERLIKRLKSSDLKLTGPITHAMLQATDMIRKMNGEQIYYARYDISEIDDIEYVVNLIEKENNVDLYGIDIYNIVKSQSSFNDIANNLGLSTEIVYKVKGLFR